MTKTKAQEFVELAKPMYDAAREIRDAKDETRTGKKEDLRKKIANRGFEYARSIGNVPAGATRFDPNNANDYQAAVNAVQQMLSERNEQVSNALSSDLAEIVGSSDSDRLEGLLGDEDFTKFTPKAYSEWFALYTASKEYAELVQKAAKGKLEKEEMALVIGPLAEANARRQIERIKALKLSYEVQQTGAQLARFMTETGYVSNKKELVAAAEKGASEVRSKLKEYEKEKGLDSKGYVTAVIHGMSKDPRLFTQARDKLYSAISLN